MATATHGGDSGRADVHRAAEGGDGVDQYKDISKELPAQDGRFRFFSTNKSKKHAEIWYLLWFVLTAPFQGMFIRWAVSYSEYNDSRLIPYGFFMGLVAWGGATFLSMRQEPGRPWHDVYGFKVGAFIAVWAFVGGYVLTDPWYQVMHGHFAFNTAINPNGVPFFMLPLTIAVFGVYVVYLCVFFRILWWAYRKTGISTRCDTIAKAAIFIPISALLPVLETIHFESPNYCFDSAIGKWWINMITYGWWMFGALWFVTRFDETPTTRQPLRYYVTGAFATVGFLIGANTLVIEFVVPHYTTVLTGVRSINDWSADNCLGPRPTNGR